MYDILKFDRPEQFPKDEILDNDQRVARGWATVEVKDKQGDIVPIDQIKKVLNTWMSRGAPMMDQHTNRPVGKGLTWQIKEHPKTKKQGILLDYMIFSDYSVDDTVWKEIKSGKRQGLSIGGRAMGKPEMKADDFTGEMGKYISDMELYEISPVDGPANQFGENIAINYMAKSTGEDMKTFEENLMKDLTKGFAAVDINKPFAGFENNDSCESGQKERGHSDESAKRICGWLKYRTDDQFMAPQKEESVVPQESNGDETMEELLTQPIAKERIYIKPGQQAPKGAHVQSGEKGGKYYEAQPGQGSQNENASPEQARIDADRYRGTPKNPYNPINGKTYARDEKGNYHEAQPGQSQNETNQAATDAKHQASRMAGQRSNTPSFAAARGGGQQQLKPQGEGANGVDEGTLSDIAHDLGMKFDMKGVEISQVRDSPRGKVMQFTSPDGDGQVVLLPNGELEGPDGKKLTDFRGNRFNYSQEDVAQTRDRTEERTAMASNDAKYTAATGKDPKDIQPAGDAPEKPYPLDNKPQSPAEQGEDPKIKIAYDMINPKHHDKLTELIGQGKSVEDAVKEILTQGIGPQTKPAAPAQKPKNLSEYAEQTAQAESERSAKRYAEVQSGNWDPNKYVQPGQSPTQKVSTLDQLRSQDPKVTGKLQDSAGNSHPYKYPKGADELSESLKSMQKAWPSDFVKSLMSPKSLNSEDGNKTHMVNDKEGIKLEKDNGIPAPVAPEPAPAMPEQPEQSPEDRLSALEANVAKILAILEAKTASEKVEDKVNPEPKEEKPAEGKGEEPKKAVPENLKEEKPAPEKVPEDKPKDESEKTVNKATDLKKEAVSKTTTPRPQHTDVQSEAPKTASVADMPMQFINLAKQGKLNPGDMNRMAKEARAKTYEDGLHAVLNA